MLEEKKHDFIHSSGRASDKVAPSVQSFSVIQRDVEFDNDVVSPLSSGERKLPEPSVSGSPSGKTAAEVKVSNDLIANIRIDMSRRGSDPENPRSPGIRLRSPEARAELAAQKAANVVVKKPRKAGQASPGVRSPGAVAAAKARRAKSPGRSPAAAASAAKTKKMPKSKVLLLACSGLAVLAATIGTLLWFFVFRNDDSTTIQPTTVVFLVTSTVSTSVLRAGFADILSVPAKDVSIESAKQAQVTNVAPGGYLVTVTDAKGKDLVAIIRGLAQAGDVRLSVTLQLSKLEVRALSLVIPICPVGRAGSDCNSCASGYTLFDGQCVSSTPAPTATFAPTQAPTLAPTEAPTLSPTEAPTLAPTVPPTAAPTAPPTEAPTEAPETAAPTQAPTEAVSSAPTESVTSLPTESPATEAPVQP